MAKTFAPEEMRARVDRLRREGRMPSVEQFMAAMENACAELALNVQNTESTKQKSEDSQMLKPLVLRRRDDHSVRITLVRYQDPTTLPYFFGYPKGWHLPAVFVRSVWEVAPEVKQ